MPCGCGRAGRLSMMLCKSRFKAFIKRRTVRRQFCAIIILVVILHGALMVFFSSLYDAYFQRFGSYPRLTYNWSHLEFGCENEKNNVLGLPVDVAEHCQRLAPEVSASDLSYCKLLTCQNLLSGAVSSEIHAPVDLEQLAVSFINSHPARRYPSDTELALSTADCEQYRQSMKYQDVPVKTHSFDFPLAYNLLVHEDAYQVSRLLRAIYRPQNAYCIHVDAKSSNGFRDAIRSLAKCFKNVRLSNRVETIVYAGFSRLQADINCMSDHLNIPDDSPGAGWRYLINTAGQAFPLRTNEEIVSILRLYNGTNDVEGLSDDRVMSERFVDEWIEQHGSSKRIGAVFDHSKPVRSGKKNPPPPHGLKIVKGSAYGAFSRQFVEFMVEDERARDLLQWSRTVFSPDEIFWPTLHHTYVNSHLNTPGGFPGDPTCKAWLSVYVEWVDPNNPGISNCRGKSVRDMCVFGVGDLPILVRRPELFANKFYSDYEPLALDCLEAWLRHKETCSDRRAFINIDYYKSLLAPLSSPSCDGKSSPT